MVGEGIIVKMKEKKRRISEQKELITRILSSFLFVPAIILLYFASFEVLAAFSVIALAVMAYEIFSLDIKGHNKLRIAMFAFCAFGIFSFMYCRNIYGISWCIFLVCMASFSDIGAYCMGKALKGPKLCPKISPNKTWAGFWGGVFLANVACYCLSPFFMQMSSDQIAFLPRYADNFFIVQCVILSAVLGDLLESWFKRKIGVKDMGNWFPGHGGVLDRLDSLVGVSVFLYMIHFFI
ncbi:MAG: CDP-archaeol synthase [Alphaproteobacteria bacterium]|nr:CDP-archaeol synthase [Alphaproteobacteria bacterium]